MKTFVLLCGICLQLGWSYCASPATNGVAAVAYQDSSGNRYGGTYGLNDGQVASFQGFPFAPQPYSYSYYNDFAPEFFRNLENLLQDLSRNRRMLPPFKWWPPLQPFTRRSAINPRAFYSNIRNQQIAFNAARKAFDLTSNQAGYFQPFPTRYQPSAGGFSNFPGLPAIPGFPDFPTFDMPNFGDNSAFASASLMAGMGQQIAAISPSNPNQPNINKVTQFSGTSNSNPGMSSVSSSSYASSTNVNGKQVTSRGAQTTIDDNGKVVTYKVQS